MVFLGYLTLKINFKNERSEYFKSNSGFNKSTKG